MAEAGLRFASPALQAAGLGLSPDPRSTFEPQLAAIGPDQLAPNAADAALVGQPAPPTSQFSSPGTLRPPPARLRGQGAGQREPAAPAAPSVLYSPSLQRFSVGGVEFGREDYDIALQSPQYLERPNQPRTPAVDWQRIDPAFYQQYLSSISGGRGLMGNLAVGVQNVGEGIVGGIGRGLQMLGAEGAGQALVDVGEAIGVSPAEQARSAAIAQEQGLVGQIGTATVQSAPTLGVSIGAGLAGAAVGGPIGALAGVALSILPMELQASWEAAEQGGLDTSDPEIQTEILASTLFKTGVQTFGAVYLARGLSPAFRTMLGDVSKRTMGARITRGIGAGALEGSAEAIAQATDRVAFDPELRALMTKGDWAAIAPAFVNKYGTEALVAFGAGFLLGAPLGAIASPEAAPQTPPSPRRNVDSGQQIDALSGATLEPQAQPGLFGELPVQPTPTREFAGPQPQPAAPVGTQLELPLGPEQPGLFAPMAEPAPTREFAGPQPQPAAPVDTQLPLDLPPVGEPTLFTPAEMGVDRAAAARLQPEQALRPSTRGLLRGAEPPAQPVQPVPDTQLGLPLQPPPATARPLEGPMNALRQRQEALAAERARREAEFAAAEQQRMQQDVDRLRQQQLRRKALEPGSPAVTEWDALVDEKGHDVTLDMLPSDAQQTWVDAVREGTADEELYNQLRETVRAPEPTPPSVPGSPPSTPAGGVQVGGVDEAIASGVGTITVTEDGKPVPFKNFALSVDGDRAEVGMVERERGKTRAGIGRDAYVALGDALAARGITLQSSELLQAPGKRLWERLVLEGKARRNPQTKRFEYTARTPTPPTGGKTTRTPPQEGAAKRRARKTEAAAKIKKGETGAVQEQGAAPLDVRQRAEGGQAVGEGDAQVQETPQARVEEVQQPEVQVVEGRGGRRELEPVAPAEPEAAAEPEASQTAQQRVAAEDLAEVEALIEAIETTPNEAEAMQQLVALVGWAEIKTQSSKAAMERAQAFLRTLEGDPATARQLNRARAQMKLGDDISKARSDVEKARADAAAGKKNAAKKLTDAEARLEGLQAEVIKINGAPDSAADQIIGVIEKVNAGGVVSLGDRSKLVRWWSEVKGSDPYYNDRPLADYITGGPDFFNYGPRINGHRQVVAKGTGRTSRTTFNFVGGAFNNLDGSSVSRALPHGKAKMVISAFRSKLKRAPSIKTFTSVAQLKRKDPALYARAAAARPQGDFDNVTAAGYSFGDGEVLIFTDNVANEAHLRFVLAHETMGHYGLRGFIPAAEFDKTMESIYDNFPHIQGPVDAAVARVEGLSKAEAVEEYLSDYAALLENNLILRVWNAIKSALNSLGLKFADDYARYLVNHARQYARRPGTGHFADMDTIAQRANGVETGAIAPGRYKRSDDVFGTLERTMSTARLMFGDRPLPKRAKAKVTTDIPNSMNAFKNEFLSLFQFQQRKNPGLQRLGEIVQAGVDNSLYIRNILNEVMAPALNLAVRIPGTNIRFGGRTPEEIKLTNDALAVTRIRASQRLRDDPKLSQSKTPIFRFNETTGEFDETGEAERLDSLTRLTLDEFRSGFTAELKRDTGEVQKFVFEGDPTATEKSGSWIAYNALRDGLIEAEKRLLKAKLQANTTTIDAALEEIASLTPTNRLDAEQRRLIRKAAQLYSDLYRKGAGINPQTGEIQADAGAITKAEEFLAAFNTAIIADKPASVDTDLTDKDSAASRNTALAEIIRREASKQEADDIVASIEKFKDVVRKEGKNPLQQDKFFIQQKIASLNAAQFVADNGEQGFRTTVVGQYTPITQEGKYQGRVVPVDARTGEPVALGDAYGGSMGYTQFETQSEADAFAESFRNLMVDDNGDPLVFDVDLKGPAGETVSGKVRFEMRVDDVETEVTAPLQLNLNEFMLGVARYSIPLKPAKMEEILTDLTRQDDRARKRLLTEFTAGDPRNGTKNIATHVDGRASTISKTLMRPEIERLMSRRNKRSRELWDGDPKRVEVTRNRYERLMADPGASREQVDAARRDYEEAQMLFNETGGRPNKFKNQAGKLLAFMNDNERLTESNFDSNEYIARWRNLTAIFQLGASLATAALNPISVYTNVAPYLATRNTKTAFGGGFGMGRTMYEINRAFKLVGLPGTLPNKASAKYNEASFWESVSNDKALQEKYKVTDFEARMLAQEIRQGSMQPALTNTMSQTARGMATTGVGQKAVDGMMFMFNVSEQASRRAAGLAAFRMEFARRTNAIDPDIKAGTPEYDAAVEQAYRDSVKFVSNMLRETLGEYSVVNRPNFFRSGIAGMLYMYKVFPTTSIQLFRNMDAKGKAWMLLGLWMLGGIAAFPFAEDIEDLLDTLEQKFGIGFGSPSVRATLAAELEAIQPGLGRWVLSGVGGQMLPFDVASRVALSPLPATEFFLAGTDRGRMYEEILGPMPSAAMGATQFVVDAVRAPFSPTITAEDVAREAPITGVRLLADTYAYLNSGAIVDRRGYVVEPDVQWYDIAARLAGFYPTSAAQEYSTIRIVNRIANYRREMSAQFRSEWVQARIRNDRGRMQEIEEAVRDWNRENRGTPLQIDNFRQGAQRAYRDATRPATERTLRTTPRAGRDEFEAIMESLTR